MFLKNIVKLTGLLILIAFSFFYSDRVLSVVSSNDSLMLKIKEVSDDYKIETIDGILDRNTIIPGISGKIVNVEDSYKKMREIGKFNDKLLVYDLVKPKNSLDNNSDKYIVHGNYNKKLVSIIFIIDNDRYLDKMVSIVNNKNIVVNYFVTYDYLIDNSTNLLNLSNSEIYNYGDDGEYTPDNLLFANNLITRITKNSAKYCLAKEFNYTVLSLCSKNDLFTIVPDIIIDNNLYVEVKNKLNSGSIILVKLNNNNVMEMSITIDYIRHKGLDIVGLSTLLSE